MDAALERLAQAMVTGISTAQTTTVTTVVRAHELAAASIFTGAGVSTVQLATRYSGLPTLVLDVLASRRGGTARTFRTLINRHLEEAAPALDTLVTAGIARGQSIDSLSRAVIAFLTGQLPDPAFRLPRMGGLTSLAYDGRRIARSETMNALREANLWGMWASTVVQAAQWQTNSAHKQEDRCDDLATDDRFGLGPGFYPLHAWPLAPHPHCGCYQGAIILRPEAEWGTPLARPSRRSR